MNARAFLLQIGGELVKARRRSLLYGVLVVQWFFCVLPAAIGFAAWRNPELRSWATGWVTFPGSLWHSLQLSQYVIAFCVAIWAAALVGSEYSAGTWKMILPRNPVRYTSLLAKFVTTLILAKGALWGGGALAVVCGWLGSKLLGVGFAAGDGLALADIARTQAFFSLELVLMSAIAIFMVVVTRSFIGGVLLALVSQTLLRLLVFLPFGWVFPAWNLDRLEVRWFTASRLSVDEVVSAVGHDHGLAVNLASVIGFSLLFLIAAAWIFERRDMLSE